ncbi:ClbS/DfsB family four-helix bundle protein [Hahella ganghwensis]|uniref:ClbS/DfsB family four-helix bundle protein n=1 Tax=Hahella ganghwensis TaxID=286420 RepID=UPI000360605B|nr:ClbS/DfsB family four-helix bundle protein [Hahella ganghwensis]
MARPSNKKEMIEAADSNFEKLWSFIESMPEESLNTEFDFSGDIKKKEAHWERDTNLRDILIHLYEWHQLLLKWVKSNLSGDAADFLPAPYSWKTYGDMNVEFWKKHQNTSLESSEKLVKSSHKSVIEMVQKFSNEELFTKKYFDWTGTTSLGSYCVSTLSSHYEWAIKKLKAHAKKFS